MFWLLYTVDKVKLWGGDKRNHHKLSTYLCHTYVLRKQNEFLWKDITKFFVNYESFQNYRFSRY